MPRPRFSNAELAAVFAVDFVAEFVNEFSVITSGQMVWVTGPWFGWRDPRSTAHHDAARGFFPRFFPPGVFLPPPPPPRIDDRGSEAPPIFFVVRYIPGLPD